MNNIIFTKVKFYRNLKDYKFVPKLAVEQKEEIINKLKDFVGSKMSLVNINSADAEMINFLRNNRLLMVGTNNVLVSIKENMAMNLFSGEHIVLVSTGYGYDKSTFDRARDMINKLSNKTSMVYSDEYGYLMSDISKIGAGVEIECDICLNAIKSINKIDQVKQNMRKLGYNLKSTDRENVYTLSTSCNLGFSEQEIFDEFSKVVSKLNDLEIESAKMLDVANHDEIVDKSRRSLAILESAYLMTYEELDSIIMNIRMGKNLDLIDIDANKLSKLERLILDKTDEFTSKSELISLANTAREILKGE
ncbi:MAG: hypothetical protein ACLRFL_02340 [Clostridia bacterium]